MKDRLKAQTRWARNDGQGRWTLGLATPADKAVSQWLMDNYRVEGAEKLASGTLAVYLVATPRAMATLMELPTPTGGSRHESNKAVWW